VIAHAGKLQPMLTDLGQGLGVGQNAAVARRRHLCLFRSQTWPGAQVVKSDGTRAR
jgi:hypothetical protein